MKPVNCPFCGVEPIVRPLDPDLEGDNWARVQCDNKDCPAQPGVNDGLELGERVIALAPAIKAAAIQRWNRAIEANR